MAESRTRNKNAVLFYRMQCALILIMLKHHYCSAACPPPPVQCSANSNSCNLTNYRDNWEDQNPCKVSRAFFPKTESELIHAVAYAVKKGKKIKVISKGSHSESRLVCPGGDDGVVISTRDYNSRIEIHEKSIKVTVDAGVELRNFLDAIAAKGLALPHGSSFDFYLGIAFRYFKKSEDYLGHKKDSVVFEFVYFRYRDLGTPRWNGHVIDEIEQILLQKYRGVPHWGKNRAFEGAAKRRVNLSKFLEVKNQFDPEGFFSSEWSDAILGIGKGVQIWRDGCALEGLCVCKEDCHCAPDKGFVCKAGTVWKNARVCRKE